MVGRRARVAAVAVPLLVGLADAAATIAVVAEGGRCGTHCTGGILLLPFAPAVSPLWLAGVGSDDATVSVAALVTAYAVVLALTALWWWIIGGLLARRSRSALLFVVGAIVAVGLTFLLKFPTVAVEAGVGPAGSVAVEAGIWALLLLGYRRVDGR